jgi:hypothetical protein
MTITIASGQTQPPCLKLEFTISFLTLKVVSLIKGSYKLLGNSFSNLRASLKTSKARHCREGTAEAISLDSESGIALLLFAMADGFLAMPFFIKSVK